MIVKILLSYEKVNAQALILPLPGLFQAWTHSGGSIGVCIAGC